ncbi:hypothetical protein [Chryseolinea sp. H1M3-3]|nr:hypothetical protein [Chryseolinea sp. H1M3-3]
MGKNKKGAAAPLPENKKQKGYHAKNNGKPNKQQFKTNWNSFKTVYVRPR